MIETILNITWVAISVAFVLLAYYVGKRDGADEVEEEMMEYEAILDEFNHSMEEDVSDYVYIPCPFKKGDTVRHIDIGCIDTVVSVPGMQEYDEFDFSGAQLGFLLKENSWEEFSDWELAPKKKAAKKATKKATKKVSKKSK